MQSLDPRIQAVLDALGGAVVGLVVTHDSGRTMDLIVGEEGWTAFTYADARDGEDQPLHLSVQAETATEAMDRAAAEADAAEQAG